MATEKPRFSIMLEPEIFEKVEAYRFEKKISTRSKAVAKLVEIGLKAIVEDNATGDGSLLQPDEARLLDTWRALDDEGKRLGQRLLEAVLTERAQE